MKKISFCMALDNKNYKYYKDVIKLLEGYFTLSPKAFRISFNIRDHGASSGLLCYFQRNIFSNAPVCSDKEVTLQNHNIFLMISILP